MADNKELTDEEIGLIACFCWSRSKELLNKEKHDMLNDEEFTKLEKTYFEEKEKRKKLEKLLRDKDMYKGFLDQLNKAKDNEFEEIHNIMASCVVSYFDQSGNRAINEDYITIDISYDQFIDIIKDKLNKVNKEIEAIKATYMSK